MPSDEAEEVPCDNDSPDSPVSSSSAPLLSESDFQSCPSPVSTRKRPRIAACLSSANISLATKNRVIARAGSLCWLCGLNGRHVAHVIPRSDHLIFTDLRASNLLTFASLHSFPNLIYLCPGCHSSYDERVPAWTFLPTDLDPFLAAEQAYHDLRAASYPTPVLRPEPVQAALYTRYQIRAGYVFTRVFRRHPTKAWAGSPVAAIIRSAGVLCGVKRLGPALCGIPDGVALKLQRLLWMYGKADPEVPRAIQEMPDEDDDGDDDGDATDEDDNHDDQMDLGKVSQTRLPSPPAPGPSSPPSRRTRKSFPSTGRAKEPSSQQHGRRTQNRLQLTPPKSRLASPVKSNKRRKRNLDMVDAGLIENQWVYGPKATANEVALWYRTAGW